DWMLAAPGISRTHAVVRYVHGLYFLEDRSTNGMLRNGAPLVRGEPVTLDDGDRLQMDTFEVAVALSQAAETAAAALAPDPHDSDATIAVPARPRPARPAPAPAAPAPTPVAAAAAADDPWDLLLQPQPAARAPAHDPDDDPLAGLGGSAELDPLRLFDPAPETPAVAPAGAGWNHSAASADHFRPPQPPAPAPVLPEEWDLTRGDFAAPPAAPAGAGGRPRAAGAGHSRPPQPPAPAPVLPEEWDLTRGDFAAPPAPAPAPQPAPAPEPARAAAPGAGDQAALPPGTDAILAIVVDGVMEVLRARAEIKNTFRLPVTIIQRSENNPLKFAATPDEA